MSSTLKSFAFLCTFVLCIGINGFSQTDDYKLADHYFKQEEYQKAKPYFENIIEYDNSPLYFEKYLICLDELGEVKEIEKILKKRYNRNPSNIQYGIDLAQFYQKNDNLKKANQIFDGLIDDMTPRARGIIELYNGFRKIDDSERALIVLQKGRKILKNNYPLNIQFADFYGSTGDTEKMIQEYLELIEYHPSYLNSVKRVMTRQVDFLNPNDEVSIQLKNALISKVQKNPNNSDYSEMLTWYFIQTKKFNAAFIHLKAEEKKRGTGGNKIMSFGAICAKNGDFRTAKKCYQYVIGQGKENRYYWSAEYNLLNVSFQQITTSDIVDTTLVSETVNAYKRVIKEIGDHPDKVKLKKELAEILAYYAGMSSSAVDVLKETLSDSRLTGMDAARVKMSLADIYVLRGEVWDASLLYMQIDSEFKYEVIGQEAKFKNARIFYFDGEFEFAQSQLDVLKQATSKLISNDAIELSVLLTENYGLDSNYTAMYNYAQAELLIEQHKYKSAFILLDSIISEFPGHSLGDEIVFKKGRVEEMLGNYEKAVKLYEELLKYYSDDILADNALYRLAVIYDDKLVNREKALEYYKEIVFQHKGSFFTEASRKRILELR